MMGFVRSGLLETLLALSIGASLCTASTDAVSPEEKSAVEPHRLSVEHSVADSAIIPVSVPSVDDSPVPAAIELGRHIAKVSRLVNASVVHIQSVRVGRGGGTIEETGSGVVMQMTGYEGQFIVTNQHVINGAELEDIQIGLNDGRIIRPLEKREDPETDICLLLVRNLNIRPAQWGNSDALDIGHMVLAMGSPFGLSKSITLGIISAKGRRALNLGAKEVLNQDFLQTDAAINPGNSGGPLIDMYGRVVGINTAIASSSGGNEGIGFSIPSNLVQRVAYQLLTYGRVRRAYLGVLLDDKFDVQKARKYSLDRSRGARVVTVYPNTPASLAGIQTDDLILSFDGHDIEDENHLIHLVSLTEVNRTVRLVIIRGGRRQTVQVRLTDRRQLDARSAIPRQQRVTPSVENVSDSGGVEVHQLTEQLAPQLGFAESARGVVVMSVAEDHESTAALQLYDVIEEVARQPVDSVAQFTEVIHRQPEGCPVLMKVRRVVDGQTTRRLVLWQPR
jgi:serine protease Do